MLELVFWIYIGISCAVTWYLFDYEYWERDMAIKDILCSALVGFSWPVLIPIFMLMEIFNKEK